MSRGSGDDGTEGGDPKDRGPLQISVFSREEVSIHALPPSGRVTIGRAPENDIRLKDIAASRRHAVLHIGGELLLERVSTTNKLFVGAPREMGAAAEPRARREVVNPVPIAVGDAIYVGSSVLVIWQDPRTSSVDGVKITVPLDQILAEHPIIEPPGLRTLFEQAERVARSSLHVVLEGEAGVGKRSFARAIHLRSPRLGRPFLSVSCEALSSVVLLESELFGHERGAFPEAVMARPGIFELADGGTVYLAEVDALPAPLQGRLRVALDEKKVYRMGGGTGRHIDVRVIASTRRDLRAAAARGAFSEELRILLGGMVFAIPPLRDRVADIAPLATAFLLSACRQSERRTVPILSPEALSVLAAHAWPGNTAELRNTMERAAVLCPDDKLLPEHLAIPTPPAAPPVSGDDEHAGGHSPTFTSMPPPAPTEVARINVVFFSANPSQTTRLALEEEYHAIAVGLESARYGDTFSMISKPAAQIEDLQPALNRYRPTVVHFSGHGVPGEQIILTGSRGEPRLLGKAELTSLFRGAGVRVVVLNACYSAPEAEEIATVVDCAVGMKTAIGDKAAAKFSAAFYAALAFGRSVKEAFEQGLTAVRFEGVAEADVPELVARPGVDPAQIVLLPRRPGEA